MEAGAVVVRQTQILLSKRQMELKAMVLGGDLEGLLVILQMETERVEFPVEELLLTEQAAASEKVELGALEPRMEATEEMEDREGPLVVVQLAAAAAAGLIAVAAVAAVAATALSYLQYIH
jgi:hypothetical protein